MTGPLYPYRLAFITPHEPLESVELKNRKYTLYNVIISYIFSKSLFYIDITLIHIYIYILSLSLLLHSI